MAKLPTKQARRRGYYADGRIMRRFVQADKPGPAWVILPKHTHFPVALRWRAGVGYSAVIWYKRHILPVGHGDWEYIAKSVANFPVLDVTSPNGAEGPMVEVRYCPLCEQVVLEVEAPRHEYDCLWPTYQRCLNNLKPILTGAGSSSEDQGAARARYHSEVDRLAEEYQGWCEQIKARCMIRPMKAG